VRLASLHRRLAASLLPIALASSLLACGAPASTSTPAPPSPTNPASSAAKPASPTAAPSNPTVAPKSAGSPTSAAAATRAPAVPPGATRVPENLLGMSSPDYAAQVFLWGNAASDRDLKLAKDAGLRWVKQSFEWRYIEPHVKGKFDWEEPDRVVAAVNATGLKLIARIDNQPEWVRADKVFPVVGPPDKLSDFTDFLAAVAARYKGRIQAYEIWNEPNLAREWGNKPPDAKAYVAMLREANRTIKAIDPDAVVISAGLAPTTASGAIATPDVEYLKQMYQAGLKGNADMVGVHAAGYKAPPEISPDDIAKNPAYNHGEGANGRIYGFRHVEDLRNVMIANGDADRRVAILEMGWTSDPRPNSPYKWHSVTEDEKADYLVRAFQFARQNWKPWVGVMSVIYISSPFWTKDTEQYYWAITNPDGTVRPAYTALQKMPK